MVSKQIRFLLILTLGCAGSLWALAATKGTPLGGLGTGYLVFDATTGDFATSCRLPPGGGNMQDDFKENKSSSAGFHFFAGGQVVTKAKTAKEDAKCPLYTADFGKTNNVNFSLTAFGPFVPGDNDLNTQLAASPLAFFEITARNDGATAVDVAAALEFTNKSAGITGLLGGAANATIDPASENKALSFATAAFGDVPSNPNNTGNAYILSDCSKPGAVFSAGAIGTFATTGTLSNANGNILGAKVNLAAGESVKFKFVAAWWRTFVSGTDRYNSGKKDDDNYYYHNFYATSKDVATFGLQHFDYVKDNIVSIVNRLMASNFPEWYKDRLFNNLYPSIHNSLWAKDGRAAYWEGGYGIIGTIDQSQHASLWYTVNWPKNQWLEYSYWLSNMFQRDDVKGQIHHDFNMGPGMHFDPQESRFMAPWGHWDRSDYWFQPNTTTWSDLNSMLIFKAYDLMMMTGNKDSLSKSFPKLVMVADRLYAMSQEANASIPIGSKSTYDSDGILTPQFACGVAVAAYKSMVEMAKFVGDQATETKYQAIYETARTEYKEKLFNSDYGALTQRGWAEGHVGGYSWANYFCLPPIQDKDFIEAGCTRAWNLYATSPVLADKVGGWHFYTYDHLGGAFTAIGKPDTALKIHELDWELYYKNLPGMVFWQSLFSTMATSDNYFSYMTAPSVWRSYFQFTGYRLDNANKRLWIRPSIPTVMNKKILDAPLPNPYGWGTLLYDETGNAEQKLVQTINVFYDVPVTIKELVLKNNTNGTTPFIVMNDRTTKLENFTVTTEDFGLEKNIRIVFGTPVIIGPAGLEVQVYSETVGTISGRNHSVKPVLAINTPMLSRGKPILLSIDNPGNITVDLLALNGAKIGTLLAKKVEKTGAYSFPWNGKTIDGKTIGTVAGILRVTTTSGIASRLVFNSIR